ncbi:MAG: biotin/lipoyl-binding protein [Fibrobacter sp.]|nr:biotin/lipoyl-binding protein [Fibrobacter sp.]
MKRLYIGIVLFLIILLSLGVIALHIKKKEQTKQGIISGMVEARHIDVASKLPGRIDSLCVQEGDYVTKGQYLAILEGREVSAKVEQARGAMNAAFAKMKMTESGARPQELDAAEKVYLQAKAQYELMEKTFNRVTKLYNDNVISSQERDQAETQYISAREQMNAARIKFELASEGARKEEKAAAQSLYYQAQNVYNEVSIYEEEKMIRSPVSGEVEKILSDPGEIVAAGYPVVTVIDTSDYWVIIQIKETELEMFKKGTELSGIVPALGNKAFNFYVHYMSAMADFATWRPTNQKGEFDIRTFELRLKSKETIENIRPGMTVNFFVKK